jgi:hypothetical protein
MNDVARFTVAPKIRCCHFAKHRESSICGEIASWKAPSQYASTGAYFCEEHRRPEHVPIAGTVLFRRVSLQIEVLFAGVSPIPAMAQAEALARLERAVESAGGMLSIKAASSVVGYCELPGPPVARRRGRPMGS